jgi:hypothetical protein
MSHHSDNQLSRIADNLDRIATSLEASAAMAQEVINTDPTQQFNDVIEAMKNANPVMRKAFEQVEGLMLGKAPTEQEKINAPSSD